MKQLFAIAILVLVGCAPTKTFSPSTSMSVAPAPQLSDDLELESIAVAAERSSARLLAQGQGVLRFGALEVDRKAYADYLARFARIVRATKDRRALYAAVQEAFVFLRASGESRPGEVFITSYFEPIIEGSRSPTVRFSRPLYRKPPDLTAPARPYLTRAEIDGEEALAGKGLEICWVDPVDGFFLHIQGSGRVRLEDGSVLTLNFAAKNGHPYHPIGKEVMRALGNNTSMPRLEAYLRSLTPEDRQRILNANPSYVFFKESTAPAVTSSGVSATAGRTIATDSKLFPKGGLAVLRFDRPVFADGPDDEAPDIRTVARFVIDQDTGGAITGPGRVDLFWGTGSDAKKHAGVVRGWGTLYYLVPRVLVR